jgi:hypothetical protein
MKNISFKTFKVLATLHFCMVLNFSFSQDTLEFKDGKVKYGHVLGFDTKLNILEFQNSNERVLISVSELKSFTKNQLEEKWNTGETFSFSKAYNPQVLQFSDNCKYLKFEPRKFSLGLNFTSLFDPDFVGDLDFFGRIYSTNPYLECFFQMEINDGLALRIPARIGIKPLKTIEINPQNSFYGMYTRELLFDLGIEPIFYFRKTPVKTRWFFAPSLFAVLGKPVARTFNYNINLEKYEPLNNQLGYRIGALTGFQYWFHSRFQFELSYGLFVTNNYWEPDDFYNPGNVRRRPYFGRNLRTAVIYKL